MDEETKQKVTWVKPQDLTLDNARTEYCKILDLFIIENQAAHALSKTNQEQLKKINELTEELKELKKNKK